MAETYAEWRKQLMVGLLTLEEQSGKDNVDMLDACKVENIDPRDDWLVRFLNESQPDFGSGTGMFQMYSFSLSLAGRELAERYRSQRRPKTFVERLTGETSQRLVNVGNFLIAALALIVAFIAMLKD